MSLRLLVDEDSQSQLLIRLLQSAGHEVLTAQQAALAGRSDKAVLDFVIQQRRTILTSNCRDFISLAHSYKRKAKSHAGILLIYQDINPGKDMTAKQVITAMENLTATGLKLDGQIVSLNKYNY